MEILASCQREITGRSEGDPGHQIEGLRAIRGVASNP
jgi:hypothetical protein